MNFIISHKSIASTNRRKTENQDCYAIIQREGNFLKDNSKEIIIPISDGMGGLVDSAEASHIAIDSSLKYLINSEKIDSITLADSIVSANNDMLEKAGNRSMGATLTILYLNSEGIQFSHIGDCRLIIFNQGKIDILTGDDTEVGKKLMVKNPTIESIRNNSMSKNLSKSLGEKKFDIGYIQYSKRIIELQTGSIVISCTDGVWTELNEIEMVDLVNQNPYCSAETICDLAFRKDNSDDTTIVTVKVI